MMREERVMVRKIVNRLFRREEWVVEEEWVRLIPYPYDWEVDGE